MKRGRPGLLGAALVGLLGLNVALAWVALQAVLLFPLLVWHALAGRFLPESGLPAYGRHLGLLALAQGVTWLLTAAVFLGWIRRVYRTLATTGATGLRHDPGRAVAAFLVPGVNLVAPLRVMRELWWVSAPSAPEPGARTPPLVAWWWGTLLLSVLADLVLWGRVGGPGRLGAGGLPMVVLGEILRIVAAVLAMTLVLRINRDQGERLGRLATGEVQRG
jgi:hypothetical protein